MFKREDLSLYLITDRRWLGDNNLEDIVEEAILNGVSFLQLREKDIEYKEFKQIAIKIKKIADKYNIPFVINDNIEIAKEIDADGAHIGQDDMNIDKAREVLGKDKIIGLSANTLEDAILAEKSGADYIGVGPVFPTNTKLVDKIISKEELIEIRENINIPIVGIGGINKDNVIQLKNTGIDGICVISAIMKEDNIGESTKDLYRLSKEILYEGSNI